MTEIGKRVVGRIRSCAERFLETAPNQEHRTERAWLRARLRRLREDFRAITVERDELESSLEKRIAERDEAFRLRQLDLKAAFEAEKKLKADLAETIRLNGIAAQERFVRENELRTKLDRTARELDEAVKDKEAFSNREEQTRVQWEQIVQNMNEAAARERAETSRRIRFMTAELKGVRARNNGLRILLDTAISTIEEAGRRLQQIMPREILDDVLHPARMDHVHSWPVNPGYQIMSEDVAQTSDTIRCSPPPPPERVFAAPGTYHIERFPQDEAPWIPK